MDTQESRTRPGLVAALLAPSVALYIAVYFGGLVMLVLSSLGMAYDDEGGFEAYIDACRIAHRRPDEDRQSPRPMPLPDDPVRRRSGVTRTG